MEFKAINRSSVPELSTEQMIEVDRAMIEDYGIQLIQMMENAGRALAMLCRDRFLGGNPQGKRVIVLAGAGGNGGGAMVAARRLVAWGADVQVFLSKTPDNFNGIPAHQLSILQNMGVSVTASIPEPGSADVILDGIIGYSLQGAPRGHAADLIRWANSQTAPVLSLDTPSGLDTGSGTAFEPGISATATLTLALPKRGLRHARVGELYLADISVPHDLYQKFLGLSVDAVFAESDILLLR